MSEQNFNIKEKCFFIVEDDAGLAERLQDALELKGARAILAHNKEDAITCFETSYRDIDFIIMDTMLPKDKHHYELILGLHKELDNNRISMENAKEIQVKIEFRSKRQTILSYIDSLIDKTCGLTIAKEFVDIQNQKGKTPLIPLLFLSAISPDQLGQQHNKDYLNSEYFIKPVTHIDEILFLLDKIQKKQTQVAT
jgi:ActR/RegA family two-component response regulator